MTRTQALADAFVPLFLLGVAAAIYLGLSDGVQAAPFYLCLVLALAALVWLAVAPRPPAPVMEQLILDGLASRWLLAMLPLTIGLVLFAGRVRGVGPQAWVWAGIAGLLLSAAAFRLGRMDRGPLFATGFALIVVCVPFAFGVVTGLDAVLDRSPVRVEVDRVDDMFYGGNGRGQISRIDISGADGRRELSVSASLYGRLKVGGHACLGFHRGALGMEWFDVQSCA